MTEREAEAIRCLVNGMRDTRATFTSLKRHMSKHGFSDLEISKAVARVVAEQANEG